MYDMNKRTSQGDPAGTYSADKLQWRYYLAGVSLKIEADSGAIIADTRSLDPRGCLHWSIGRGAHSLLTDTHTVYAKRMLQFYSHFIMTRLTNPRTSVNCLLWTQLIRKYNRKAIGSFYSSLERNPSTSLVLRSPSHPLVLLPAKARALTEVFGDTKAVLALAAMWPVLVTMLLERIFCEASCDGPANRAEETVTGFMATEAAGKTTSKSSTEATIAISGLFTALSVLLLVLAVSSNISVI